MWIQRIVASSIVGSITGAISFLGAIIGIGSLIWSCERATAIILGIYGLIFLAWAVWREYVFSRKARFAEAMIPMQRCHLFLKMASEAIGMENQALAFDNIQRCLGDFAGAFSLIAGVSCRACIKSVAVDETRGLARDKAYVTKTFCRHNPSDGNQKEEAVPVSENTDFENLSTDRTQKHWMSNDISKWHNYKNSSLKHLKNPAEWAEYFKRKKCSYISTIVWPISINNPVADNSEDVERLIGFLCIDSKTRNVFSANYDVELGLGLAETLFPVLYDYYVLTEKNKTKRQKGSPE